MSSLVLAGFATIGVLCVVAGAYLGRRWPFIGTVVLVPIGVSLAFAVLYHILGIRV